jgi:hypothetical protein
LPHFSHGLGLRSFNILLLLGDISPPERGVNGLGDDDGLVFSGITNFVILTF